MGGCLRSQEPTADDGSSGLVDTGFGATWLPRSNWLGGGDLDVVFGITALPTLLIAPLVALPTLESSDGCFVAAGADGFFNFVSSLLEANGLSDHASARMAGPATNVITTRPAGSSRAIFMARTSKMGRESNQCDETTRGPRGLGQDRVRSVAETAARVQGNFAETVLENGHQLSAIIRSRLAQFDFVA